jgi:hypothetical protein
MDSLVDCSKQRFGRRKESLLSRARDLSIFDAGTATFEHFCWLTSPTSVGIAALRGWSEQSSEPAVFAFFLIFVLTYDRCRAGPERAMEDIESPSRYNEKTWL